MIAVSTRLRSSTTVSVALAVWSSLIAVIPSVPVKVALLVPAIGVGAAYWSLLRPSRWLILLFGSLALVPPLASSFGDSGLHVAPLFAALGVFVGAVRMPEWRPVLGTLQKAFIAFLLVLTESVALAALYSGPLIAIGSLVRVLLFSISIYVFFFAAIGPRERNEDPMRLARLVFWIGTMAALFACLDFFLQLPAPARFGAQFVWLDQTVLRRAQGLFYEASTLGNFCAFFLIMIVVSLFRKRKEAPCSRIWLGLAGIVFFAALILSYSRGSVINFIAGLAAMLFLKGIRIRRALVVLIIALFAGVITVHFTFPAFSQSYWERISVTIQYFWSFPDQVLSGRLSNGTVLLDFLRREPWHVLFGIGYKTLPYSDFVGATVIADNTYLTLLVETGLIGLAAFIALNFAILRTALRAARSNTPRASFFGDWIFCFWVGQMSQMLTGDLITYWRVLPLYFWVLGVAARESAEGV
jgi:O-antigen ligase